MGQDGMGCPVEMEFSVNLNPARVDDDRPEFAFLQLRPMTARAELAQIDISNREVARAFCVSEHALGNALRKDMADIIYVKPDVFDPSHTREIARQIGRLNAELVRQERRFLLIGSGRWGSADHWLGIPVGWADISGVGAIVEAASDKIQADPSQGSHFFHNITTMGINYITIARDSDDLLDWEQITSLPLLREDVYVAHTRLEKPLTLKVDGRISRCVGYF